MRRKRRLSNGNQHWSIDVMNVLFRSLLGRKLLPKNVSFVNESNPRINKNARLHHLTWTNMCVGMLLGFLFDIFVTIERHNVPSTHWSSFTTWSLWLIDHLLLFVRCRCSSQDAFPTACRFSADSNSFALINCCRHQGAGLVNMFSELCPLTMITTFSRRYKR